jgi:hypothetical protein
MSATFWMSMCANKTQVYYNEEEESGY